MGETEPESSRRHGLPFRGGLPHFCAVLPVVWCLSHAVTHLVVGAHVGRQSSTSGIGPFLMLLAAPFLGAVGWVVGRLATRLLGARLSHASPTLRLKAVFLLLAVGAVAAWQAGAPILAAGHEARPRVLVNTMQIQKRTIRWPAADLRRATRVYDVVGKLNSPIQWDGRSVQLVDGGDALELRFATDMALLRVPLTGIDYIIHVDAIPLRMGGNARPVLALLITGRATGARDLIAVIAASGELVYLELLERFWNFREVPLAAAPSAEGDLLLVGTDAQNLLAFAP